MLECERRTETGRETEGKTETQREGERQRERRRHTERETDTERGREGKRERIIMTTVTHMLRPLASQPTHVLQQTDKQQSFSDVNRNQKTTPSPPQTHTHTKHQTGRSVTSGPISV